MRPARIVVLLALTGCWGGASARTDFDGAVAFGYIETQLGFGPRIPNTEAHRRAGDWLEQRLRDRADAVMVQAFDHVAKGGDTLRLRNFVAQFAPAARERVVYLAHWDTRPRADRSPNLGERRLPVPGANDGASGVALLLGIADALRRRPPALGVDLVFVDGEDYGDWAAGDDVLIGSRYYASRLDPERRPLFAVVWDMVADRDLEIYQEQHSVRAAPEVVERVWRTAAELGYGRVFRSEVRHLITDDHVPLIEAGVRAIDVIDFDYGPGNRYWHTPEDTLDKVSAASLQVVGDVALTLVR